MHAKVATGRAAAGVGAKGVAEFTVGSEHILDYLGFIKLQLLQ